MTKIVMESQLDKNQRFCLTFSVECISQRERMCAVGHYIVVNKCKCITLPSRMHVI